MIIIENGPELFSFNRDWNIEAAKKNRITKVKTGIKLEL